ncbi:MAG: hypothetical protein HFI33_13995 [Lachnospiraceae bacterium]|nr:hypothetical protein [Lachnospiraceae bacterium]
MVRTAFSRRENGDLLIHQISQLPKHFSGQSLPLSGGLLQIKKSLHPCKALQARLVYPSCKVLSIQEEEAFWIIKLPDFKLQQLVEISLEKDFPES